MSSNPPFLAYPEQCGSSDMPGWVEFGIYERLGTKSGNLESTIGLYMPDSVSMPSTVSWENEAIGLISKTKLNYLNGAMGHQTINGLTNSLMGVDTKQALNAWQVYSGTMVNALNQGGHSTGMGNTARNLISQMAIKASAELAKKLGITNNDGGALSSTQASGLVFGQTTNPYLTAIFRGVDFRTFEFSFRLYPHNESQCETIHNIVKTFRGAYLPKYSSIGSGQSSISDGILDYPKEFSITYKWGSGDNKFVHKFKRAVMTSFDTNYSGTGQWQAMRNAMPASIVISMRFSEVL